MSFDDTFIKALTATRAELEQVSEQFAVLELRRDELKTRLDWLEKNPILQGHEEAAPEPEPVVETAPIPEPTPAPAPAPRKSNGRPGAPLGPLFLDVTEVLKAASAPMRATEISRKLVADPGLEYEADDMPRILNNLARWGREGKLSKEGRGMYTLPQ